MAEVLINGVFMGANIKTSNFDGVSKSSVYLDLYQKDSNASEKTVTVKSDDVDIINVLNSDYDFGSVIQLKAQVNAYQNKAYFKLLELVG